MPKDLFSKQHASYAKYRPSYPKALIDYVIGYVENKQVAWDCATGNGQAALPLAEHFAKVVATDISEKQLALAEARENIQYIRSEAEHTLFAENTFNLITVAQAYHWFNFDEFEKEVRRVSKNGGVIAIWCYDYLMTGNKKIDEIIQTFYGDTLGNYWDKERKYVEAHYETVPFNFARLPAKRFSINAAWSIQDLTGYLNSWSAVQHYMEDNNVNPVDQVQKDLAPYWKQDQVLNISFPVFLKIGKIIK